MDIVIYPEKAVVSICQVRNPIGMTAFPKIAVGGAEPLGASLQIVLVDMLHQLIYTEVSLFCITAYFEIQSRIYAIDSRPNPESPEKIIAIDFADIRGVILEPLKVETTDFTELRTAFLIKLMGIDAEMAMVPIRRIHSVLFRALRTAAGSIAPKPYPGILDRRYISSPYNIDIAVKILGIIAILVIFLKEPVPFVLRDMDMNLRYNGRIVEFRDCLIPLGGSLRLRHINTARTATCYRWYRKGDNE
jgi:hypothetical protein